MNDIIFSNSFRFYTISRNNFSISDVRSGAVRHYFAYMISGKCKIVTDSETLEINRGDIFYIPNKCRYKSYWYGNPQIKFVSLGFSFLPNSNNLVYPPQVIPGAVKALLLIDYLSSKTRPTAADIGIFYTLCGILIPKMHSNTICRTREIAEKAKKYLIEHPNAKTDEIAKHCTISEAALYSAFHKASDITLNELRNNLRLEKAKDMLITTDKTVEYISDFLQFSSTSYFRKKFKQYFNITPTEMRKQSPI